MIAMPSDMFNAALMHVLYIFCIFYYTDAEECIHSKIDNRLHENNLVSFVF